MADILKDIYPGGPTALIRDIVEKFRNDVGDAIDDNQDARQMAVDMAKLGAKLVGELAKGEIDQEGFDESYKSLRNAARMRALSVVWRSRRVARERMSGYLDMALGIVKSAAETYLRKLQDR